MNKNILSSTLTTLFCFSCLPLYGIKANIKRPKKSNPLVHKSCNKPNPLKKPENDNVISQEQLHSQICQSLTKKRNKISTLKRLLKQYTLPLHKKLPAYPGDTRLLSVIECAKLYTKGNIYLRGCLFKTLKKRAIAQKEICAISKAVCGVDIPQKDIWFLGCGHVFDKNLIKKWFQTCGTTEKRCPVCRHITHNNF